MNWQRFAGTDPVQETIAFDNHQAYLDACELWADDLLAEADDVALGLTDYPEPIEDPNRYATIDEYYGGLLAESCGPLIEHDIPGSLDPAVAREMRARIRRRAA